MSQHKIPLTEIEETGLLMHCMGRDIGKPSMSVDLFRSGVAWALLSESERQFEIKKMIEHGMPFDDSERTRLASFIKD